MILLKVASSAKVTRYLNSVECTIEQKLNLPKSFSKPFVFKRGDKHLKKIQQELGIINLKKKYGNKFVGVDYPSSMPPPTEAWHSIKLKYYIEHYIEKLDKMSIYDAYKNNLTHAYLWGPTDYRQFNSDSVKNKDRTKTQFVPDHMYDHYSCPWREDKASVVYGLAGKYTGLPFHRHTWVSNEIIYGKKLWMLYPPEININTQNLTSIEMIFTMIEEYIDDETFQLPQMCILEAGDVINIPKHWNHMSFNLETTAMAGCLYEIF